MDDSANFDILFLLSELKKDFVSEASFDEISTLLYLSCFININNGKAYSDWNYKFYLAEYELTSTELTQGIKHLKRQHHIEAKSDSELFFSITKSGLELVDLLKGLSRYQQRIDSIKCACDIVLTSSVPHVINGIYMNSELKDHKNRASNKRVLEDVAQQVMFKNLESVCEKVGLQGGNSYASIWTWLTYNIEVNKRELIR